MDYILTYASENEACLGVMIGAQGFWGDRHQSEFFDVWVHPFAPSNHRFTLASHQRHEREKRSYEHSNCVSIYMGTA